MKYFVMWREGSTDYNQWFDAKAVQPHVDRILKRKEEGDSQAQIYRIIKGNSMMHVFMKDY